MPANKSQHYTPRCHFKPFSKNREGSAIQLFNIKQNRSIENASINGQCASSYFYGEDQHVERALSLIEGRYAAVVRKIENDLASTSEGDLAFLMDFALLQALRTKSAAQYYLRSQEALHKAVFREWFAQQPLMTEREAVEDSIELFTETRDLMTDLKKCLVVNRTKLDFITSDDPSVFLNRFSVKKEKETNFGFLNSGAIFSFPLTPRLSFFAYDGLVYTVPGKSDDLCQVFKESDIEALNEFQLLYADRNIYFQDWSVRQLVETAFNRAAANRIENRFTLKVLFQMSDNGVEKTYRDATPEEMDGKGPFLIVNSTQRPIPMRWPSFLKFRQPFITFSNGTGVGHVRKREWLTKRP